MIESQWDILQTRESKYLSIGITSDGEPRRSIAIPWERTGNAYNMRTPNVYLSPADLADEAVWAALERFEIIGCYCFCPMTDYGFLMRLPKLQDVHIRKGFFLEELSFLTGEWFQLYLEDAVLRDLNALFPQGRPQGLHSHCVALVNCHVADHSALLGDDVRLSELVIGMPRSSRERARWREVPCGKFTWFEFD